MKVFTAEQIREWDQYTISHGHIASIELMERAACSCVQWIEKNGYTEEPFSVFCGKGNNGGDGLAIARLLSARKYPVKVYILDPIAIGFGHKGTVDFQFNLASLHDYPEVEIKFIQSAEHFPTLQKNELVIDALFGSGLNRGLEGVTKELVGHINESGCRIISIDVPSGLFVDRSSKGNTIIRADHTLSFQCYKPAFLVAENSPFIGEIDILDIRLNPEFYRNEDAGIEMIDEGLIRSIYKPRNRFAHKGNFGHALLVAGSYGKMGAAVLAAKGCLRSGVGLLSCHIPKSGYDILQSTVPEAMVLTDFNSSKFSVIGLGPGIGTAPETKQMLNEVLTSYKNPLVLDADALNCLATENTWLKKIPSGSIITPHPKEFERLFGESENDFDRIHLAKQKADELGLVIVLKGHHSLVAVPGGKTWFNFTGNAGMAKGGSGDVLTGMLTALLAQGYTSRDAALVGVYLHGLAGDLAAKDHSQESMLASDIAGKIGEAFKILNSKQT